MRKMMKVLSFFTAVAIASSLFAGCGTKENSAEPTASAAKSTQEQTKPVEISWCGFWAPTEDNQPVQAFLEKKYNVKLKIIRVDRSQYDAQVNLKIAGGEMPDVFKPYGNWPKDLADKGMITSFTKDELRSGLPNWLPDIEKKDPNIWNSSYYKGKYWGVPDFYFEGTTGFLPAYNGDMLKAAGFAEAPKTLDELEKFFAAVKASNKNAYGLSGRGKDLWSAAFQSVFGAFNVSTSFWNEDKSGKLVYGMTTENAKQALKILNRWYKLGYIDPEFITEDAALNRSKFANGRVAMNDEGMFYHLTVPTGNIASEFKAKNPNTDIVVGPALKGPDGNGAVMAWGGPQNGLLLSARFEKDKEAAKTLFKMLDGIATDEETWLMANYGQVGVHYDMVNGMPVRKAEYSDIQKTSEKIGAGMFFIFGTSTNLQKYRRNATELANKEKWCNGMNVITSVVLLSESAKAHPEIDSGNIQKEYLVKFITGEVDIDKGFDDFVKKINDAGIADMAQELNRLYTEKKAAK